MNDDPSFCSDSTKSEAEDRAMSWTDSVYQVLCFGWIDGVRKRLDEDSYAIRFTPRRPDSVWSSINIRKVAELSDNGLMRGAGLAAFEKLNEKKSRIYAYEKKPEKLSVELEKLFRKSGEAWDFFQRQPPGYKRLCYHFLMGAKQEKTRITRLEKLILVSKVGKRL